MYIREEKIFGEEVRQLLARHLNEANAESPAESVHALPLSELQRSDITLWCAWHSVKTPDRHPLDNTNGLYALDDNNDNPNDINQGLMGFAALKKLSASHAELKSMRTHSDFLRQGVASALLQKVLDEARQRGFMQVSLETGSMASYQPAVALYKRSGFEVCGPFADYQPDPNSLFLTLQL